jgi:uncharacterized protein
MEAKDHNYGVAKEQGPVTEERGPVTMGTQEERTMSVLAHLSIFLNVGFQALQSMWYQVAWLVILVAGWTVTTLLMFVLIGFLLVPVMALITLVPFVHSAYAAYRVSKDGGYRYPLIADMIEAR